MEVELNPNIVRATYQSPTHYQEAIGLLEMANKTQKKVFVGDDGEVRLANWWDRLKENFFSIFGYVNHTDKEWVANSVKVLVEFGKERWKDEDLITKIQELALGYGIVSAPTHKEGIQESASDKTDDRIKTQENGLVIKDIEELVVLLKTIETNPQFEHLKVRVDPETNKIYLEESEITKDVQRGKPSRFSLKKLFLIGLALFGGNKLWGWNQAQTDQQNKALVEQRLFQKAIEQNNPDAAEFLGASGAKISRESLELAAQGSSQDMFISLTREGGLDLTAVNNDRTLLHAAALNDDFQMLDYLLSKPGMDALTNMQGSVEIKGYLLKKATPLASAVFDGNEHNVQVLLNRRADPSLKCQLDGKEYSNLELAKFAQSKLPKEPLEAHQTFDRIIDMLQTKS